MIQGLVLLALSMIVFATSKHTVALYIFAKFLEGLASSAIIVSELALLIELSDDFTSDLGWSEMAAGKERHMYEKRLVF